MTTRFGATRRRVASITIAVTAASALLLASSSAGAATTSASQISKAKTTLAQAEKRPTSLKLPPKITKSIPTGKSVIYLSCGTPSCTQQIAIYQQAADTLGWHLTTINTTGTPSTIQSAFVTALREKPDAITYSGFASSLVNPYLTQAKAAGITVVAGGVQVNPLLYYANITGPQFATQAPAMAAWVTAQSKGTGSALFVGLPDFPTLTPLQTAFVTSLAKQCPACSSGTLSIPLTDVGTTSPNTIVSYLRAHSKVKYVVVDNDALTIGLPAALQASGLTGISLLGTSPTTTNLQYILKGQEYGSVNADQVDIDYSIMDALARKFAGVAKPTPWNFPVWIITPKNFNNAMVQNGNVPTIPNEVAAFKALWGK